jgi:hypothetical protein
MYILQFRIRHKFKRIALAKKWMPEKCKKQELK